MEYVKLELEKYDYYREVKRKYMEISDPRVQSETAIRALENLEERIKERKREIHKLESILKNLEAPIIRIEQFKHPECIQTTKYVEAKGYFEDDLRETLSKLNFFEKRKYLKEKGFL